LANFFGRSLDDPNPDFVHLPRDIRQVAGFRLPVIPTDVIMVAILDGCKTPRVIVSSDEQPIEIKPGAALAGDERNVAPTIALDQIRNNQAGTLCVGAIPEFERETARIAIQADVHLLAGHAKIKKARPSIQLFPAHPSFNRGLIQFVEDVRGKLKTAFPT